MSERHLIAWRTRATGTTAAGAATRGIDADTNPRNKPRYRRASAPPGLLHALSKQLTEHMNCHPAVVLFTATAMPPAGATVAGVSAR
jgi:hypothetical protein